MFYGEVEVEVGRGGRGRSKLQNGADDHQKGRGREKGPIANLNWYCRGKKNATGGGPTEGNRLVRFKTKQEQQNRKYSRASCRPRQSLMLGCKKCGKESETNLEQRWGLFLK